LGTQKRPSPTDQGAQTNGDEFARDNGVRTKPPPCECGRGNDRKCRSASYSAGSLDEDLLFVEMGVMWLVATPNGKHVDPCAFPAEPNRRSVWCRG